MKNLNFLIAAYSAIWFILAFYIFVLIQRNQKLVRKLDELEARLKRHESKD